MLVYIVEGTIENLQFKRSVICIFVVSCISFFAKKLPGEQKPWLWIASQINSFKLLRLSKWPKISAIRLKMAKDFSNTTQVHMEDS